MGGRGRAEVDHLSLSLRSSPRPQLRAKPHTNKWGGKGGKKAGKPYLRDKPHTKKRGGEKGGKTLPPSQTPHKNLPRSPLKNKTAPQAAGGLALIFLGNIELATDNTELNPLCYRSYPLA